MVGGAAPGRPRRVKAVNAYDKMVCAEFDLAVLEQFKTNRFADTRSRPAQ